MNKDQLRDLFNSTKPYVKYSVLCKECGVDYAALSHYLSGKNEFALSEAKLKTLYDYTCKFFKDNFKDESL